MLQARHIPNLISLARLLLVAPILWLLLEGRYGLSLALFAVASVSDALDGLLAKRYGWTSRLGGVLDPLADKLLLVGSYLVLGWLGALPWWIVGLVLTRDLVIVGGALAYRWWVGPFEPEPSRLSKWNTLLQLLLVIAVLVDRALWPMPPAAVDALLLLTAGTTIASGLGYVLDWGRRAGGWGRDG